MVQGCKGFNVGSRSCVGRTEAHALLNINTLDMYQSFGTVKSHYSVLLYDNISKLKIFYVSSHYA